MKHVVPHDLDPETARRVAELAFQSYRERFTKYTPTLSWLAQDRAAVGFSAKGIHLDGELALRPGAIEMTLEVPFLLRVFRERAIRIIEEEIRKWIAAAKTGEV